MLYDRPHYITNTLIIRIIAVQKNNVKNVLKITM
jgi:hypothetical protein